MNTKYKIAGLKTDVFKLAEVKGMIDPKEIKSIMDHGKIMEHVYYRIRSGILVLVCSTQTLHFDLEAIVEALKKKVKDQKKKSLEGISLFQFSHQTSGNSGAPLLTDVVA